MKQYSVLMSVYYKEKPDYLRQSMQSIYRQTVPTDDFVLVCDGPLTPELDEVIAEMQELFGERLHVLRLLENQGLGRALNAGIIPNGLRELLFQQLMRTKKSDNSGGLTKAVVAYLSYPQGNRGGVYA